MSKLAQLRTERADLVDKASALNSKYGNRAMPSAEADTLNAWLDRIDQIDAEAKRDMGAAEREGANVWQGEDGREFRVMRSAADFRAHYRQTATPRDQQGATLGDFVRGIAGLPTSEPIRAALSVGTDADGGYLVPSVVMPRILEALAPASSVLTAGAGILPLDTGAKTFTLCGVDAIPTAAWRAENGAVSESAPTFRGIVAAPKSLAFYFKISRELLADGAGLTQAVVMAISQAFAAELDRAALRGTGSAPEPRGVLNTTNVNAVTNGAAGASLATTKFANIFSAAQLILEDNAAWPSAAIMSPRSRIVLAAVGAWTGQPLRTPSALEDMKMISTTAIPNNLTVTSSTDCSEIYVGSFDRLLFAMREQISIQKADQLFAANGQIAFVCHCRADVLVTFAKAFAVCTGVRP